MAKRLLLLAVIAAVLFFSVTFYLVIRPKEPAEEKLEIVDIIFRENETERNLLLKVKNEGKDPTFISEIRIWEDSALFMDFADLHIRTSVNPGSAVEGHRIRIEPQQTVEITVPKVQWTPEKDYRIEVITSSGNTFSSTPIE